MNEKEREEMKIFFLEIKQFTEEMFLQQFKELQMKFPSTTMEVVLFIIINDRMISPHENIDDLVMLILIHVDIKQFQIKKEL